MEDSFVLYVRVERQRIAFITKTFEAMSHLAVVTTVDQKSGLLRLLYASGSQTQVRTVLESLSCQIVDKP